MAVDDLIHRDDFAALRDSSSAGVGRHYGDNIWCAPGRFNWFDTVSELTDCPPNAAALPAI